MHLHCHHEIKYMRFYMAFAALGARASDSNSNIEEYLELV